VSAAKRGGRFSYLTSATESSEIKPPSEEESGQENDNSDSSVGREDPVDSTDDGSGGGGGGRSRTRKRQSASRVSSSEELASVPKGKGRMKQERSQLNVRVPTTLKRRASAKAVLEGRDIGEIVEELLREYLER
jgi:hypothetical protein